MNFLDIANSNFLYILVIIGIVYILFQCFYFLRMSLKRAKELNLKSSMIKSVIQSSAIFSIAPSLAIVLGLAALAPSLGIPWPWLRLSVIGSVSYELMAANMASSTLGFSSLIEAHSLPESFGVIMLAMSTGVAGGMIMDIFLIKKVNTITIKLKKKQGEFGVIALSVLFFAVLAVFIVPIFGSGLIATLTFLTSMLTAIVFGILINKYSIIWLKNFVLAFSLIIGMASSVLWTGLL